jgi:hypothetical protein
LLILIPISAYLCLQAIESLLLPRNRPVPRIASLAVPTSMSSAVLLHSFVLQLPLGRSAMPPLPGTATATSLVRPDPTSPARHWFPVDCFFYILSVYYVDATSNCIYQCLQPLILSIYYVDATSNCIYQYLQVLLICALHPSLRWEPRQLTSF